MEAACGKSFAYAMMPVRAEQIITGRKGDFHVWTQQQKETTANAAEMRAQTYKGPSLGERTVN